MTIKRGVSFIIRYFMVTPTAAYGNCFTFNSALHNDVDEFAGTRVSSLTGPNFGLTLVLNLDTLEYLKGGFTKQVTVLYKMQKNLKRPQAKFSFRRELG